MQVMKFGGTSVTREESVKAIVKLVERDYAKQPVLVVSALSGVTDLLVKLSHTILDEERYALFAELITKHSTWISINLAHLPDLQPLASEAVNDYLQQLRDLLPSIQYQNQLQFHDSVVSFGELMSSRLISMLLNASGFKSERVSATNCIITTRHFGGADFIDGATKKHTQKTVLPLVKAGIVPVITGFIGATNQGETTILGRGGSDYSAAIIGYALGAEEIQIWTDVNGVFSADPRVINNAKLLKQLSYQEAAELAMFGAKVLHPRTIQPAVRSGIPVRVLNTFNLDNPGTLIAHHPDNNDGVVKAVTWRNTVPLINIYSADMFLSKGFLQKIFAILANNNISVNMISASEVSVSVTLDNIGKLDAALIELNKFAKADYIEGFGTVSLVGDQIMKTHSLMQNIFNTLEALDSKVQMLSYSASTINISMLIPTAHIPEVSKAFHDSFVAKN